MLPRLTLLRAQSGLADRLLRWIAGDAAKVQLLDARCVGRAEKRAHVIHAAHIVQQNRNRQAKNMLVSGGGLRSLKREALHGGRERHQLACTSRIITYCALAIFSGMRNTTLECGPTLETPVVSMPTKPPLVSAR